MNSKESRDNHASHFVVTIFKDEYGMKDGKWGWSALATAFAPNGRNLEFETSPRATPAEALKRLAKKAEILNGDELSEEVLHGGNP